MSRSAEEAERQIRMTMALLHAAGFMVNLDIKSCLIPSLTLRHLGFFICTVPLSLGVLPHKIKDIRCLASTLMIKTHCQPRTLAKLIGKLLSITLAWKEARSLAWPIIDCLVEGQKILPADFQWSGKLVISEPARRSCEIVFRTLHLNPWRTIQTDPLMAVFTDAAGRDDLGWGVHIPSQNIVSAGRWSQDELESFPKIHHKELFAVLQAVLHAPLNARLHLFTDSKIVRRHVEAQGGLKRRLGISSQLILMIQSACAKTNIEIIQSTWIPGSLNKVADWASRFKLSQAQEIKKLWKHTAEALGLSRSGWTTNDSSVPLPLFGYI